MMCYRDAEMDPLLSPCAAGDVVVINCTGMKPCGAELLIGLFRLIPPCVSFLILAQQPEKALGSET